MQKESILIELNVQPDTKYIAILGEKILPEFVFIIYTEHSGASPALAIKRGRRHRNGYKNQIV